MVNNRENNNPFKYLLGKWVQEPINFSLALEILDRLYWTRSPKPNIFQKSVKDLTKEILNKNDQDSLLKIRIEIYKLESLTYIKRHMINDNMYLVVSIIFQILVGRKISIRNLTLFIFKNIPI